MDRRDAIKTLAAMASGAILTTAKAAEVSAQLLAVAKRFSADGEFLGFDALSTYPLVDDATLFFVDNDEKGVSPSGIWACVKEMPGYAGLVFDANLKGREFKIGRRRRTFPVFGHFAGPVHLYGLTEVTTV